MKILFISSAYQPDYLCDSLYHGLKKTYGADVESANDMWYMYDTMLPEEKQYLYGKGFSLYGLLNGEIKNIPPVAEIIEKIKTHYYTYVVYGSIQQCNLFLNVVLDNYPSNKIAFIDGEDRISILDDLTQKGVYFKRELINEQKDVYPISFGIPAEKIVKTIPAKSRDWAINYPGRLNTYIHKSEESYYADYQQSKFAATFKKEGWDCLRHYEILANGCLPYFKDLDTCPQHTLANFPKEILLQAKTKIESAESFSDKEYTELVSSLLEFTAQNLTTESLVVYVLKILNDVKQNNNGIAEKQNSVDHDIIIKAKFIDQALSETKKVNPIVIHRSLSSAQELRYLENKTRVVYANTVFKSAIDKSWQKEINLEECGADFVTSNYADVIILDMVLPYQEDMLDYMQNILKAVNNDTRLIIVVPNYKSFSTVLGFIKNDLKFGRLTLAKKSQVNFYSIKSLEGFLKSFNLQITRQLAYDFDRSHFIKRVLNKFSFLRFFTGRKLMIEARVKA
jgi:hypothetical protein